MRRADQIDVELPPRGWAFDRRHTDVDGRLHVTDSILTTASVCPYLGREIPGCEALGLDPSRIYQLYRDADALKAALPQFENLPLMLQHVATSAANPQKQLIAGSISNARWQSGKVIGDLAIWDKEAIALVESGEQRELSCGYAYTPSMKTGRAPDGTPFDGRMLLLALNHCALVRQGRVPGAAVNDAAPYHLALHRLIPGYGRLK
jgi:hypothetical protein